MNRLTRARTVAAIAVAFSLGLSAISHADSLIAFSVKNHSSFQDDGLKSTVLVGAMKLVVDADRDINKPARLVITADKQDGKIWDLSGATLVTTIRNTSDKPLTVRFRAENETANGLTDACEIPAPLLPGESREVKLRIVARPVDPTYAPFKPFMMYFKNINVRDNTVDPKTVTQVVVSIDRPEAGQSIELSKIDVVREPTDATTPFLPFVDQYGQYIHSEWYGKIHSDADFSIRREEEARERADWPGPQDWNEYGGWKDGPTLEATGHFRVQKHEGKWWLVDPAGKLYWSNAPTGVGFGGDLTPITDRENWFKDLPKQDDPKWGGFFKKGRGATYMYYENNREWVGYDVARANLVRKYGDDYEKLVSDVSHERLRSWGFNSMANWSAPQIYLQKKTPYTVAIHYDAPPIHYRMADIYAPEWEPNLRARLMREKETTANDPWCIGYFVDNERWWGWRPRAAAIGEETLKNPPTRHAKIKMVEMLKAKYQDIAKLNEAWKTEHSSWDALLAFRSAPDMRNETVLQDCGDFGMMFAERYFSIVKDAVKQVAPNTMYLGARFHGHIDKSVVELAGKYADVVSYNIYDNPPNGRVNQYRDLDLPIMITEWGVGSDPTQTPFRGERLSVDPKERARQIEQFLTVSIRHPNIVGAHFFQYRDQPISGRPDGEGTLRGYVNIVDTPNFELVQTNRRIGYGMYKMRSESR